MFSGESAGRKLLKKSERLRKRSDYLLVQTQGKRIYLRDLVVLIYYHEGFKRFGITVSRQVGGAVVRNRVKRRLREIWRRFCYLLPSDNDIILVAKRSAASADYISLKNQFIELGKKISANKHASYR